MFARSFRTAGSDTVYLGSDSVNLEQHEHFPDAMMHPNFFRVMLQRLLAFTTRHGDVVASG